MDMGLENLKSFLSRYTNILVTTHESPDPDGLGAEIAFYEVLLHLGKKPLILNADILPEKYQFMDPNGIIGLYDPEIHMKPFDGYGLVILDTNDKSNIGNVFNLITDQTRDIFVIDHHSRYSEEEKGNFIISHASSTSEMIYDVFKYFNVPLTYSAAMPLFAGILFDTGSFRYPKTSPKTFLTASALVDAGVSPTWVYETIYETYSLSSLVLKSKMLASMEFYFDGQLVIMHLTREMLTDTGGIFSEGEHNINIPLSVQNVRASVLIKQDINGPIKVSMRTKGDLNVADIAFEHNGGGHKNAAGYKSKLSWSETKQTVISDLKHFFEN